VPTDVTYHFSDGPGNTASGTQVSQNFSDAMAAVDNIAAAVGVPVPVTAAKMRGKSVIASTGTRTNAAYGALSDGPDQVSGLVVPADGIVLVSFQAYWSESVDAAARAAIFIGSNQLKVSQVGTAATAVQEAANSGAANIAQPIASTWFGLSSGGNTALATGHATPATTGTAVAIHNAGGTDQSTAFAGGLLVIEDLPAGTYDISVQWKASSGTVSALNRKLKCRVEAFG
jgi:hypothetical protein